MRIIKVKVAWTLLGVLCLTSCFLQDRDTYRATRFLEYQNAGDEALINGNYAEAEKQYLKALEVAEGIGPENRLLVTAFHSLAQVYIRQKKDGEAESYLRRRIEIAEKVITENPEYLAMVYDDLVLFYLLRDRYSEAEPLFERALAIREKAFGPNDLRVAESLEYYALLLRNIKRNDKAVQLEERAKAIKTKHIHGRADVGHSGE